MRYTGPKFKLCRREGINLFGTPKYDVRKRRKLPGQHGDKIPRLSEYGKLLRNKQVLKRIYQMSEKQFKRFVTDIAAKYSKNAGIDHDKAVKIILERRLDAILYRSGLAKTIMQARQMITHGHFLLNGKKHNIPSYLVKPGDVIELREKLKNSPLYAEVNSNVKVPSYLKVNAADKKVEVIDMPREEEIQLPADVLKVIEFYAR
jgi:small subunit ribosomal protein S4